jgi:hypothetical protein
VTIFGIVLVVVGGLLLLVRHPLTAALRSQSAKGLGPQPPAGLSQGIYVLCALAAVAFGVAVLAGLGR